MLSWCCGMVASLVIGDPRLYIYKQWLQEFHLYF